MAAQHHQAALLPQKGGPLAIGERTTPEPGANEILIKVKAIAVNPVDRFQRDHGMPPVPVYPAVVGSDVAGIVVKAGSNVSSPSDKAPPAGSRVIAFASSFYQNGSPDHGAFQEYVLASSAGVVALPDGLSFEQGAVFPLAVLTAWSGWTSIGIPFGTKYTTEEKQAVLIWGGASSVGTLAIQTAKSLGFTAIYTTASAKHHDYLRKLGAHAVFDYTASDVVSQIIDTAKKDGVTLQTAYCVVDGGLQPTLDVLSATKGHDVVAKVAHAAPLFPGAPTLEGVEVKFVLPPMDPAERDEHIRKCLQIWLHDGLSSGAVVPSPHIQLEAGGLEGLNEALDRFNAGVSGTKMVVQI